MPWHCYMVEMIGSTPIEAHPEGGQVSWSLWKRPDGSIAKWDELKTGAMYFDDDELIVKMPGNGDWNIDRGRNANATSGSKRWPEWTRTGEAPNVTVSPSINCQGVYHGWLQNGVLTSDCEGRVFSDEPRTT